VSDRRTTMCTIEPTVAEAYADVRSDATDTDWLVAGYTGNTSIGLVTKGSNGFDGMKAALSDEDCFFAYLRIKRTDPDGTNRTKFFLITFQGAKAKVLRKAKVSVHMGNVKEVLKDYALAYSTDNLADLTLEELTTRLDKANY